MLWRADEPGTRATPSRTRALVAAACFGAGIWAAGRLPGEAASAASETAAGSAALASAAIAAAGAAIALGASRRLRALALGLAVILLGAAWYGAAAREAPRDSILWRLPADPLERRLLAVEGRLLEDPRLQPAPEALAFARAPAWTARLDLIAMRDGAGWAPASGAIRITIVEQAPPAWIRAGDRIAITGWAARRPGPMNPGEPGARRIGLPPGPVAMLRAPANELIERIEGADGPAGRARRAWLRWRADARAYLAGALGLGGPHEPDGPGAMLGAIALGERDFGSDTEQAFRRVGLAHIMAISGLHLVVLIGFAALALRLLGDLGRAEAIIIALLTLALLAVVPVRAPILRAAIMALALLGGRAMGRRWDPVAVLAWTAVAVLIWRPAELWSMGFQFSFGMVGALITLGPVMQRRLFGQPVIGGLERPPSGWRWARRVAGEWVKQLIGASALCWLVALPLTLHHTGMVSPLAIPATLVTLPLLSLTLAAAWALAIAGLLIPGAADVAGGGLRWLAEGAHAIVMTIDAAPGASFALPRVSLAWAVGATVVAVYLVMRARWRDGVAWALVGGALGALALEVERAPGLRPDVALRIDTLAVGDGTCHVLRSGEQAMLWDCGSMRPGAGRTLIPRALRELGVWRTPVVILSHPNLDHYNALEDVAPAAGVRRVIVGPSFEARARGLRSGPGQLLADLRRRGVSVEVARAGNAIALGEARIELIGPGAHYDDVNDTSLVALIGASGASGAGRLLLTGDIERAAIRNLLQAHERGRIDLRAEVMEAPHHGSPTDAAYELIARISPRAIVQSSGPRLADEPAWSSMRRQRTWLQTPVDGAVWVELLRDGRVRAGRAK